MEINNFSVRNERMRRWREIKKEYYKGPYIHCTENAGRDDEYYPISFPGKEYCPISFPGREQRRKRSHKTLQIVL